MSVLRSHNNKMRGSLGRVCATGMYRSIEHVKFPKFQTRIFVEWKAPLVALTRELLPTSQLLPAEDHRPPQDKARKLQL